MKRFAILAIATAVAVPAMSQSFADRLVDRYRVGYDEAVLLGGLARDFGIADSQIFDLRNRYGYRNDDMVSALYVNRYGRADWDDIHRMRQSGMGWGQIAHSIGMHPGTFNKMRKSNRWSSDREMADDLWRDRFNRKGLRSDDVDWARKQGFSYRDAYVADQIARSNNSRFPTVLNRYRQERSWNGSILGGGNTQMRTIKDAIGRSSVKKASSSVKKASSSVKKASSNVKKANPPKSTSVGKGNSGNKGKAKKDDKGKGKGRGNGGFLNGR